MTIDDTTLNVAAAVLARRAGLKIESSMRGRLDRCLSDTAHRAGSPVDEFVARLDSDSSALQTLLNSLTVQETAFFRDSGQFDALAAHVLPSIERPTTIWSAACANGQEPYSLAMLLDAEGDTTSRVIASDISTEALERTRVGRYSEREISGLSEDYRRRYLRRVDKDSYEVTDEIRDRIEIVHLNLASDPPPFAPGSCPVIFCRNVMIYFGNEQIIRLLEQFAHWLTPDGVLFLGYSESLWQITELFTLERMGSAFVYRRRDARTDVARRERTTAQTAATPPSLAARNPRPVRSLEPRRAAVRPRPRPPAGRASKAPTQSAARLQSTAQSQPTAPMQPTTATAASLSPEQMFAVGVDAARSGEFAAAVAAFRRCVYVQPDWVEAHAQLAFALEASGDVGAARRAFSAARSTLDRIAPADLETALQGYLPDELARLLDMKLEESR